MEDRQGVTDSELPKLKRLAGDLLAAEAPDPAVLDEISALAATVATQLREHARRELARLVADAVPAVFPNPPEGLLAQLAQTAQGELSSLGALLEDAGKARAAFAEADAGLLAAHGRGDYSAMVPLAREAENQKRAFAAATAEFASRVGYGGSLTAEITAPPPPAANGGETAAPEAADVPAPPAEPPIAAEPDAAAADAAVPEPAAPEEAMPEPASAAAAPSEDAAAPEPEAGAPQPEPSEESPAGRRRIRDLIRQVRSGPEEAPAR
jgi:hypothetical protein